MPRIEGALLLAMIGAAMTALVLLATWSRLVGGASEGGLLLAAAAWASALLLLFALLLHFRQLRQPA